MGMKGGLPPPQNIVMNFNIKLLIGSMTHIKTQVTPCVRLQCKP